MKTIKLTIAFLAAALMPASCVEHQDYTPVSGEAIAISPLSGTATKAAIDGTVFPADRTMTVTAYYNAPEGLGTSANYFTATTFAKDGDVWAATPDPKYWPAGGTLDLFAWSADGLTTGSRTYPAKVADGVTVAVPDNVTAQTDIIACGVRATSKVVSGVPMAFRHAQALVCFTAGSEVPYNAGTNYGITINSITLKDAKYSGTLKMGATNALLQAIDGDATAEDGYFLWKSLASQADKALPTSSVASVKLPYNVPENPMDITAAGNHFGIGGIGILVPEQAQTRFVVEFTMHNGYDDAGNAIDNAQVFEYDCEDSWKEGIKYVYQLTFGFDEITVRPTVVDWNSVTEEVTIPHDYEKDYMTLEIVTGGNVIWGKRAAATTGRTIEYSLNGGEWTSITATDAGVQIPVAAGDKVRLRGTETTNYASGVRGIFDGTTGTTFKVSGNVMSLEYGDDFRGKTVLQAASSFRMLFGNFATNNEAVLDASHLVLPAMTLTERCYANMFQKCVSMTAGPGVLPATVAATYCYYSMFSGCSAIDGAPVILATTLAESCYFGMFNSCSSLKTAPNLLVTDLAPNCYSQMFLDCSSLSQIQSSLPAMILEEGCYRSMFSGCSSLKTAPDLPATTLAKDCYYGLFYRCSSLTSTQSILPAMTLAERCYAYMYNACCSLEMAPVLPAPVLVKECYLAMFNAGTPPHEMKLRYIKMMATDVSAQDALTNWCGGWDNVATSEGTLIYSASLPVYGNWTINSTGSGVPALWAKIQQ